MCADISIDGASPTPRGNDTDNAGALARLLTERQSCRAFLPTPLPRRTLERIIGLAALSPSWCNVQPWHVVITAGAQTDRLRGAVYEAASLGKLRPDLPLPRSYGGVLRERRRSAGELLYAAMNIEKSDLAARRHQALENFRFFGAPHVAIVTVERDMGIYGVADCGIFIGNLLLAAQSLDVAAIPQGALATVAPAVREALSLPDDRDLLCGISLGLADKEHPSQAARTARAAIEEISSFVGF